MRRATRVRRAGWAIPAFIGVLACGSDGPAGPGPVDDPSADLSVTASGPATVAIGQAATFQITLANAGPDAATNVVLRAELPAGATATAISGSGAQSGTTVSWTIGSLANGGSATRSFAVSPSAAGSLVIVASATADSDDPAPSNNDGSAAGSRAETLAIVSADVSVAVATSGPALPGESATWTVTVSNAGPSAAVAVGADLEVSGDVSGLTASDGGTIASGTVTWPTVGTLDAGASVQYNVSGVVGLISPLDATASAASTTNDADPGNNESAARVVVTFEPVLTITGEGAGDQFGWLMDIVGDVDGDGRDDVIIGAPDNDAGGTAAGRAYIYSAATGALIQTFTGAAGQRMGLAVDGAGDVDGDGVPDAIIGGPADGAGRVVVISGATGTVLLDVAGEVSGDGFGRSVSRLGDVNADGKDDVIVGAAFRGRVYVIDGATGSTLATADGTGFFGAAVGEIGDLNADGIVDFAVGSSQASGGGRVTALSGTDASQIFSVGAASGGSNLGNFWINTPGDVDGDGLNDIFAADITDNAAGAQAGRAYVFSGADGSILVDATGEATDDQFGIGRGIPDANADGIGDLFVAGWQNDEGAANAGKAYVISGADGSVLRSFVSTTAGEKIGFDAIGIDDVTGDGIADLLVSGGLTPSMPGRVYLIAGRSLD